MGAAALPTTVCCTRMCELGPIFLIGCHQVLWLEVCIQAYVTHIHIGIHEDISGKWNNGTICLAGWIARDREADFIGE